MLEARDITFAFGGAEGVSDAYGSSGGLVLAGASICLEPGETVALVGRNGSGKSTLARVLCGSLEPDGGAVSLDGAAAAPEELRGLVGLVRQDPESQLVAPTVFDEVAFGPCNLGLSEDEVRARVAGSLASCGLDGFGDRLVSTLSGGEMQRLALAGVLAMRPRYLLLDEACSQLDGASRSLVRGIVRSCARGGMGVLTITHDLEEVVACDRIVLLERGGVAWQGLPEELVGDRGLLGRAGLAGSAMAPAYELLAHAGVTRLGMLGAEGLARAACSAGLRERVLSGLDARVRREGDDATADATVTAGEGGASSEPALALEGVTVRYGAVRALSDVTLRLEPGCVTLLAGPSGSGKSTLARVASGLLGPDAGRALLGGGAPAPGMVGLCLQRTEDQLFCETVLADVAFGPTNLGCAPDEAEGRAREALRALGVDEGLWERSPFALSGGQRRRAALAGIVAMGPRAYVLDEPTVGLDAEGRTFLHELVRTLAARGHAVLVISHDVCEWLEVASRVALLRAGSVAWRGTARELVDEPGPLEAAGLATPTWVALRRALRIGAEGGRQAASGEGAAPGEGAACGGAAAGDGAAPGEVVAP